MSAEATESVGPASPHATLRAVFGMITRTWLTPSRGDLAALGVRGPGRRNPGRGEHPGRGSLRVARRAEPSVQYRAAGRFERLSGARIGVGVGSARTADQVDARAEGDDQQRRGRERPGVDQAALLALVTTLGGPLGLL